MFARCSGELIQASSACDASISGDDQSRFSPTVQLPLRGGPYQRSMRFQNAVPSAESWEK